MSNTTESTDDWYEFVEDDLETQPRDGAKILAEFENGTRAQVIFQPGCISFIGEVPAGVDREVSLKRWRYLNIP
jgi:hypothetical protein